jgi:hypothetical protein
MMFPLAFEIEDLARYVPVIVIFVLMILGSLLGNKQKQRQSEGEPEASRRGGGGQSWEEMLEDMLGGKTRTPPEAPRAEPPRQPQRPQPQRPTPPIERPTARRQTPPSRPAPPPPVPKRRPQKQRRPPPVSQGEIILGSATLPPAPRVETPAPAQVPDRLSEAGQTSAARMAVNDSEIGVGKDAYADRKRQSSDSAARLRTWLTPGTLRRDFLITEIFQPPVGLREDRRP